MSLSAYVSGGKATIKAIVADTPADKPANKPAAAKVAGKKPSGSKKSPSSSKRRESLSELPSFPEFVEDMRDPAEKIVPPEDRLETMYREAKPNVLRNLSANFGEALEAPKKLFQGPLVDIQ